MYILVVILGIFKKFFCTFANIIGIVYLSHYTQNCLSNGMFDIDASICPLLFFVFFYSPSFVRRRCLSLFIPTFVITVTLICISIPTVA